MNLDSLLGQFLGQPQSGNQQPNDNQQSGGFAQNIGSALPGDLANKIPGGLVGGLAAGGVLGVLMGNKKARKTVGKVAGGAVGLGGAAVLGALAFNAYKNWQSNQSGSNQQSAPAPALPSPSAETFSNAAQIENEGKPFQLALVKAMIAASNADGHIDGGEQTAIFEAVDKFELAADEKALVFDTLRSPPTVDTVAGYANGLEQATELYLASRLAIDPDHPAEAFYLRELASKLNLPDDLVNHLEQQVAQN